MLEILEIPGRWIAEEIDYQKSYSPKWRTLKFEEKQHHKDWTIDYAWQGLPQIGQTYGGRNGIP